MNLECNCKENKSSVISSNDLEFKRNLKKRGMPVSNKSLRNIYDICAEFNICACVCP